MSRLLFLFTMTLSVGLTTRGSADCYQHFHYGHGPVYTCPPMHDFGFCHDRYFPIYMILKHNPALAKRHPKVFEQLQGMFEPPANALQGGNPGGGSPAPAESSAPVPNSPQPQPADSNPLGQAQTPERGQGSPNPPAQLAPAKTVPAELRPILGLWQTTTNESGKDVVTTLDLKEDGTFRLQTDVGVAPIPILGDWTVEDGNFVISQNGVKTVLGKIVRANADECILEGEDGRRIAFVRQ